MCQLRVFSVIAILVFFACQMDAKPYKESTRPKRTSDQRLAELETLIALSKMNGKLVTIPIGFGKVDPNKLGRRRRSISLILQQLINDLSTEDKPSDELFQQPKRKEEDGGEEEEEEEDQEEERKKDQKEEEEQYLNEKLRLLRHPHLPIMLLE